MTLIVSCIDIWSSIALGIFGLVLRHCKKSSVILKVKVVPSGIPSHLIEGKDIDSKITNGNTS